MDRMLAKSAKMAANILVKKATSNISQAVEVKKKRKKKNNKKNENKSSSMKGPLRRLGEDKRGSPK